MLVDLQRRASSAAKVAARDKSRASPWLIGMLARKPLMLVTVALAEGPASCTPWFAVAELSLPVPLNTFAAQSLKFPVPLRREFPCKALSNLTL